MQGVVKLADAPGNWRKTVPGVKFRNGKSFETLDPGSTKLSTRTGEFGPEPGFARGLRELGQKDDVYLIKFHRSGNRRK